MKIRDIYTNAKRVLKNKAKQAAFAATAAVPMLAQAAVDVKPITDTYADIIAVGVAVFGAYVAVKSTKLVRRAL